MTGRGTKRGEGKERAENGKQGMRPTGKGGFIDVVD